MTVERFREAFPRARWNDDKRAWFVPGKTAVRRLDRWLAREADQALPHADAKGRDAYVFEPINSAYLQVAEDLRVRTPYSTTVIEQMRAIPWAHWDEELRAWRVPFRSYEELHRWTAIETAARRNEPEERKVRLELQKNSSTYKTAQLSFCRTATPTISPAFRRSAAARASLDDGTIWHRDIYGRIRGVGRPSHAGIVLPACCYRHVQLRVGHMASADACGARNNMAYAS